MTTLVKDAETYARWLKEEPGVEWRCDRCSGLIDVSPIAISTPHCLECKSKPATPWMTAH